MRHVGKMRIGELRCRQSEKIIIVYYTASRLILKPTRQMEDAAKNFKNKNKKEAYQKLVVSTHEPDNTYN